MITIARISGAILRLVFISSLALCAQILLIIRYPDYLLVVQEFAKKLSLDTMQSVALDSHYKVAYNLINGDGILVHTFFVVVAAILFYLAAVLLQKIWRIFVR